MKKKVYSIGTRDSLLALTQAQIIKRKLEELNTNPEIGFSISSMKTQGDVNTTDPLWQMEGKDFFTKELDSALLSGKTHLSVHSYKDLGLIRPKGIKLQAITKREYINDILLIKKDTIHQLKLGSISTPFIIGTSSPRRIININSTLGGLLPHPKNSIPLKIQCNTLRGNIITRINKLQKGNYHAIVLAMAGLERAANDNEGIKKLSVILKDLDFMILPLSHFPAAAAQGALAIESLEVNSWENFDSYDEEFQKLLENLNHYPTKEVVDEERRLFRSFGGGCHLPMGISVSKTQTNHLLYSIRGEKDQAPYQKRYLKNLKTEANTNIRPAPITENEKEVFYGKNLLKKNKIAPQFSGDLRDKFNHWFITSKHCIEAVKEIDPEKNHQSIWTSGYQTSEQLAKAGYWVRGNSENLGSSQLDHFLKAKIISLMSPSLDRNHAEDYQTFTGRTANDSKKDKHHQVICYERDFIQSSMIDLKEQISSAKIFYWTSYYEYLFFREKFPLVFDQHEKLGFKHIQYCCGIGKTYQKLTQTKHKLIPFADITEFKNWLKG